MTNKAKRLVSVPLGDIHLMSNRVTCKQLIRCLSWALNKGSRTNQQIDILYLNGDLLDRLVAMNHPEMPEVIQWFRHMLLDAKASDRQVRVLEGTPSHDWRQVRTLLALNSDGDFEGEGINADVKYFDKVEIEYNDKHDIHVLYIPDLKVSADEMWSRVQKEMSRLRIDMVDYTLAHGAFMHQLPPAARQGSQGHHTHDPDHYADITRHAVLCNHVHKPSSYRNVHGGGSLDRISHGEEHAKGYLRVTQIGDSSTTEFIENPFACIFTTVDAAELNSKDVLLTVSNIVESNPFVPVNIRIIAHREDEVSGLIEKLKHRYPEVKFTFDLRNKTVAQDTIQALKEDDLTQKIVLTRETLQSELLQIVSVQHPDDTDRVKKLIGDVIAARS